MSTPSQGDKDSGPTTEELREQVEHTREELGQTVEALAAKADVKAQAKEKAAEIKEQAAEKATLVTDQLREKAAHAAQLVKDKTPEPVREKAESAATMAEANRTPLIAAAVAFVVFLLLRRSRRCR
ncbi:DUF3618 domain-containing protein [Streptomyces sp. NPDC054849]